MQCLATDPEELLRTHFYCLSLVEKTAIPKLVQCQHLVLSEIHLFGFMLIVVLVLVIVGLLNKG